MSTQAQVDDELDSSLLDSFLALEEPYHDFYIEPVTDVNVWVLYVDSLNNLDFIHTETYALTDANKINKAESIALIKKHQWRNGHKYKLEAMVWYNVDLNPAEIDMRHSDDRFFHSEKNLNDIYFGETIKMFHDLNTFIIVFQAQQIQAQQIQAQQRMMKATLKKKVQRTAMICLKLI
jgi:hypothetical protein